MKRSIVSLSYALSVFLLTWHSCCVESVLAMRQFRALDYLQERHRTKRGHRGALYTAAATTRDNGDDGDDADVQELYMVQKLDHFDPSSTATYEQRYFYSDRYVSDDKTCKDKSVTFLCVGGEGPGFDTSVLIDSVHCTGDMLELASRLHAHYHINVHVYALEHRYYGKSYPKFPSDNTTATVGDEESPVTTKNLKYLSSRQALEDLSHFVHTKQVEQQEQACYVDTATEDTPETMPWVTFGGSYPGYMAGNARLKYPHLITAAVSNSAPLDLEVDFPGYNERVGWDLAYSKIGGSPACQTLVKEGHNQAIALLESDPTKLATMFHVCQPSEALSKAENQNLFLGDGLITIYAQGNDPSCNDSNICDIASLCETMLDSLAENKHKTELDVLAEIAAQQRGWVGGYDDDDDDDDDDNCQVIDFDAMLEELAEPVVEEGGWRSWLWQTCTEVGFYQTCHENCPYASYYHSVEQDLAICEAAYNITTVYENVQATKDFYGGLDIASGGSRVLSVNGNVDPWSVLGLQSSPKYSLPVEMVPGASHHFWTHAVKDTDAPEIAKIREYIYSVVMDWLDIEESDNSPAVNHSQQQKTEIDQSLRGGIVSKQ